MAWLSSGRVLNPVLDLVLLDSGPMTAGQKIFQIYLSSTVATAVEVQLRDATNLTTLKSQIIAVPAFGFIQMFPFVREIETQTNERLRLIQVIAVVGSVSVSFDLQM